jgi:uncharacterized membrane protein SpoIIM required for sporulation
MYNTVKDNISGRYLAFLTGLYQRNKTVLTISTGIFLGFLFLGVLFGYFSSSFIENFLKNLFKQLRETIVEINTLSIFIKNLQAVFIMYVGGIIVIVPVIVLSFNGFILGSFFGCVLHGDLNTATTVLTPWHFIAFTMPHGIFELPALIIAGAAGFRISTLVIGLIKSVIRKKPVSDQYWKFKDSIALLAIAIVLLFIAAIIEANFTGIIGYYLTGLPVTSS